MGSVGEGANEHYNPHGDLYLSLFFWICSAHQFFTVLFDRKSSSAMGASTSTNRPSTTKLTDGENHRVKYASSTMQGLRMSMEDSLAVELDLDGLTNTSFFGVYDGHGGAEVAMYCAKRFHVMLRKEEGYLNNLPSAIKSVCFRIDDDLKQSNQWRVSLNPCGNGNCFQFLNTGVCPKVWRSAEVTRYVPPLFEGSTACVVIIRGNQITVGNVGDSRCVLSKNGQANITGDTEFLVIASDGIWDHMSSQDVVDFVYEKLYLEEEILRTACEKLIENCLESRNNATAILVQFKPGADQPIPLLSVIEEGSDEAASDSDRAQHQHNPHGGGEQLDLYGGDDGESLLLFGQP
uniref:protein-serine/threonine phosphatase n=1 Tax=Oryza brachyantha TaxID=4533 RepID=J3LEM1_ORYBR